MILFFAPGQACRREKVTVGKGNLGFSHFDAQVRITLQKLRFQLRGQGPSNANAAASEEVQGSPAIAALLEQSEFSSLQRIGGNFWDPVSAFTSGILEGSISGKNLQEQLDNMVTEITAL